MIHLKYHRLTQVAIDTLKAADHPLYTHYLKPELDSLLLPSSPPTPDHHMFTPFDPKATGAMVVNGITIGFDEVTGGMTRLTSRGGVEWASSNHTLFGVQYHTYNISQFQAFQRAYSNLTHPPGYFPHDFGKPGDTLAEFHEAKATALSFWRRDYTDKNVSFLIESTFSPTTLHEEYGAPSRVWTRLDISPSGDTLGVTVTLVNKTATRHAEAMFVRVMPEGVTKMEMDKLGSWIRLESGLVVDGGNKHMHGVNSGVRFGSSGGEEMMLETVDAGVVVFGHPNGFPTSGPYGDEEPDLTQGVSSMILNNLWGTNYGSCYGEQR